MPARTEASAWIGAVYVEMRYSDVCDAAWARITAAGPSAGISVEDVNAVGSASHIQRMMISQVHGAFTAPYTAMVAVTAPDHAHARAHARDHARACARLASGLTVAPAPAPAPAPVSPRG